MISIPFLLGGEHQEAAIYKRSMDYLFSYIDTNTIMLVSLDLLMDATHRMSLTSK
jgi:hypothetical protein